MVPSEWSTGDSQRLGSITKVGVPAIRRIITEMVWRIVLFQPSAVHRSSCERQIANRERRTCPFRCNRQVALKIIARASGLFVVIKDRGFDSPDSRS